MIFSDTSQVCTRSLVLHNVSERNERSSVNLRREQSEVINGTGSTSARRVLLLCDVMGVSNARAPVYEGK